MIVIRTKFTILLFAVVLSINVFGETLLCQQVVDEQLCNQIGQMLIIGFGGFQQDIDCQILWNDKDNKQFNENSIIARHQ